MITDKVNHLYGTKNKLPALTTGRIALLIDLDAEQIVFGTPQGNIFVPKSQDLDNLRQDILNIIGNKNNLLTTSDDLVGAINEIYNRVTINDDKPTLTWDSVCPTTGEYAKGNIVYNSNPQILGEVGNHYIILGWSKITDGFNNELNIDWVEMRVSIGN